MPSSKMPKGQDGNQKRVSLPTPLAGASHSRTRTSRSHNVLVNSQSQLAISRPLNTPTNPPQLSSTQTHLQSRVPPAPLLSHLSQANTSRRHPLSHQLYPDPKAKQCSNFSTPKAVVANTKSRRKHICGQNPRSKLKNHARAHCPRRN